MKKIVSLVLLLLLLFSLFSCTPTNTNNYLRDEKLFYGAGCDYTLIKNYFINNGVEENGSYSINGTKCTVEYTPNNNFFQVVFAHKETNTLNNVVSKYTYFGGIKFILNQPLNETEYFGYYEHDSFALGSSLAAYYTAKFTFNNIEFVSLTKLASFDTVSYTGTIDYALDYQKANKNFNKSLIGETCYQCIEGCFIALNDLFKLIDETYVFAKEYVSPNNCNHIPVIDKGFAATCLTEGLTDGKHCKNCNTIIKQQVSIPTIEHTIVEDKGYPASCTQKGLTDGKHCSTCKTIIEKQEIIPTKHDNISGEKCESCNEFVSSKGFDFTFLIDSCWITGLGTCSDSYIVIPDTYMGLPVVGLGANLFKNNSTIEKVVILENVKYINQSAFENCINLKEIILPNTLEEISENSFLGCSSLTSIIIPSSVTSIGKNVFYNCNSLTSIVFENTLSWYKTTNINYWTNKYGGIIADFSNAKNNAESFKALYNYYWYKK